MSYSTRRLVLVLSYILAAAIVVHSKEERKKQGCFDAGSFSCDTPRANPQDHDFDLESICYQLQMDIFLSDEEITYDVSIHKDYLNTIDANWEFCDQARIAYSQCLFCANEEVQRDCFETGAVLSCGGGKPTKSDVLTNNEDEIYSRFYTEGDIDRTCADLDRISQRPFPYHLPTTRDLCERQSIVKHLCPGNCDGVCFDPIEPPSCNPQAYNNGPIDESLDIFAICDEIRFVAFYDVGIDVILNVSAHPEYLRAIPNDDEDNSSFCQEARQAYSHCSWCAEELCFNENHPATCDVPAEVTATTNYNPVEGIDVNAVCHDIYWALYDVSFPDDLYNTSLQTGRILMPENTAICDQSRQVFHRCYWCAKDVPTDFCLSGTACSSNITIPTDFVSGHIQNLDMTTNNPELYCDDIFVHWNSTKESHHHQYSMQSCYEHVYLARLCPEQFCPGEAEELNQSASYLGATTTEEKMALIWASRGSAFLTFFGAIYVAIDILADPKARTTVYHSLLIGMTIFNVINAVAWGLSTAPIPKEEASYVLGAMGTWETCKAQAFFVQLGFTSIFYNVSLAVYYVLVVSFNWRESCLKSIQVYMHALPVVVGIGLAAGAYPFYDWTEYGCHILPDSEFWVVVGFVIMPLGVSIIIVTESMLVVFWKVQQRAAASKKKKMDVSKAGQLEQAAFLQCLFYLLAVYISWPILFVVYLPFVNANGPLPLTLTVAIVAPLQGFTNFLVYLRQKVFQFKPRRDTNSTSTKIYHMKYPKTFQELEASRRDALLVGMDPSAALALQKKTVLTRVRYSNKIKAGKQERGEEVVEVVEEEDEDGPTTTYCSEEGPNTTYCSDPDESNDESGLDTAKCQAPQTRSPTESIDSAQQYVSVEPQPSESEDPLKTRRSSADDDNNNDDDGGGGGNDGYRPVPATRRASARTDKKKPVRPRQEEDVWSVEEGQTSSSSDDSTFEILDNLTNNCPPWRRSASAAPKANRATTTTNNAAAAAAAKQRQQQQQRQRLEVQTAQQQLRGGGLGNTKSTRGSGIHHHNHHVDDNTQGAYIKPIRRGSETIGMAVFFYEPTGDEHL